MAWSELGLEAASERLCLAPAGLKALVGRAAWGLSGKALKDRLGTLSEREIELQVAAALGRKLGPDSLAKVDVAKVAADMVIPVSARTGGARVAALRAEAVELAAGVGVDLVAVYEACAGRVAVEPRPISWPSWRGNGA